MKPVVLIALLCSASKGRQMHKFSKLKQNQALQLNSLNDDQDDISIYTSDFFDKADEFKTLSQQKEDEIKTKKEMEIKKEQEEINAKNKIQNEIEELKKQIKAK